MCVELLSTMELEWDVSIGIVAFDDLYVKWISQGKPKQPAAIWESRRNSWIEAFPNDAVFIRSLPIALDRVELRKIANNQEIDVKSKFLATMIWGYGDRGYGPYRVNRIFETSTSLDTIQIAYDCCQESRPLEAYKVFQINKLKGFGPSFGTKFISFMTPKEEPAPILDSLVSKWIKEFGPMDCKFPDRRYTQWDIDVYSSYLNYVTQLSNKHLCHADLVEQLIFESATEIFSQGNSWLTIQSTRRS